MPMALIDFLRQITVWKILLPKLEGLLKQDKRNHHQWEVEKRREKLNDLLTQSINSLGKEVLAKEAESQPLSESRERVLFVPVLDVDELGCDVIKEFVKAKEEDTAYDDMNMLPANDWTALLNKGIMKQIGDRRFFVPSVLTRLLVEGVLRPDNGVLEAAFANTEAIPLPPLRLPSCFSIHHAAAFLKYDQYHLVENAMKSTNAYGRVFTYADVVDWKASTGFDELVEGLKEWTNREREGGAEASLEKWKQWNWRTGRVCRWEGDRTAVELALVLLKTLGYEGDRCVGADCTKEHDSKTYANSMCEGTVSMVHMEAKGEVFVCMRCPEEGRARRTWKDLVSHIVWTLISLTIYA